MFWWGVINIDNILDLGAMIHLYFGNCMKTNFWPNAEDRVSNIEVIEKTVLYFVSHRIDKFMKEWKFIQFTYYTSTAITMWKNKTKTCKNYVSLLQAEVCSAIKLSCFHKYPHISSVLLVYSSSMLQHQVSLLSFSLDLSKSANSLSQE